ncbi:MAG: hypothetical protein JWO58_1606 [Chitinophagaceae bacterium]|nr:hypothetical protein [Chitinophagaceae bacterium]
MIKYIQFLLMILLGTGCDWREEQAQKILFKRELREDIFSVILKDTAYLSDFINRASKDSLAQSVMKRNEPLAKIICTSSAIDSVLKSDTHVNRMLAIKLVHRMEEDTASCQLMCGMVMENPVLRKHLKENICPDILHIQSHDLK